jgi:hypothetical protein
MEQIDGHMQLAQSLRVANGNARFVEMSHREFKAMTWSGNTT